MASMKADHRRPRTPLENAEPTRAERMLRATERRNTLKRLRAEGRRTCQSEVWA